ncbi:MAG: hypothetical protein FWG53_03300 [Clostridiales bacterium]|nr:hypothetical protein [Clostridiales bacterium]
MKKLLVLLLVLSLAFTGAVTATAAISTSHETNGVPILAVTVPTWEEADVIWGAGLDILGHEVDDDIGITFHMVATDYVMNYIAENNLEYTVVNEIGVLPGDFGGYQYEPGASALADEQPIPNVWPLQSNGAPARRTDLTREYDKVFDPTGILMNEAYGYPERRGFRTVTEYYSEVNYLAQTYPELCKKYVIGASFQGFPIYALEVTSAPGANDGKPCSFHVSPDHAREWAASEMLMNTIWFLLTKYQVDPQVTDLLDTTRIFFVPMSNPDGAHYDQTRTGGQPGSWRKNVNTNGSTSASNWGVDLNRNFPYDWGSNDGSTGTLSGDTYRGAAPLSEPENEAKMTIALNNMIITSITHHTYSELVLSPWGQTQDEPCQDAIDLGRRMADINLYNDYRSRALYATNGGFDDYMYGALGSLSYCFEHNNVNFARPYNGDTDGDGSYGRFGATTEFNDFYGNQRWFPVQYQSGTGAPNAAAPAQTITADVVVITSPYDAYTDSNKAGTAAKVQAVAAQLPGKILLMHTGSSNANTLAAVQAAQAAGAVGVILSKNNAGTIGLWRPAMGNTTAVTIPVCGALDSYLREIDEYVQKNGSCKVSIIGRNEPVNEGAGGVAWYFRRNIGAFMLNMDAAREYASHITGKVVDTSGNLLDAQLNLSLLVKARQRNSSGTILATTYDRTRKAVLDISGGNFDWSVNPSEQPHQSSYGDNGGYKIVASSSGKYDLTKNIKVMDRKLTYSDFDYVMTSAISSTFDFDKAWGPVGTVTVPFSTHNTDGTVGIIDGAAVSATVGGLPVDVNSLGGGNYTATFDPADLDLCADSAELVIDFSGGTAHSAFTKDIELACVYVDLGASNVNYISGETPFTVSVRDAADLLSLELEFVIDGNMLSGKGLEGLNGFAPMNGVLWIYAGDNLWKGTVTLALPSGTTTGLTAAGPVDIATFTYTPKGFGNAAMTLTGARAEGLFGDTTMYLTTAIGDGAATTIIAKSKYDLNRDGTVDALDLGIMLLYCGFNEGATDWGTLVKVNDAWGNGVTASMCDVNGDGLIDMLDLLDLFIHYTK